MECIKLFLHNGSIEMLTKTHTIFKASGRHFRFTIEESMYTMFALILGHPFIFISDPDNFKAGSQ